MKIRKLFGREGRPIFWVIANWLVLVLFLVVGPLLGNLVWSLGSRLLQVDQMRPVIMWGIGMVRFLAVAGTSIIIIAAIRAVAERNY